MRGSSGPFTCGRRGQRHIPGATAANPSYSDNFPESWFGTLTLFDAGWPDVPEHSGLANPADGEVRGERLQSSIARSLSESRQFRASYTRPSITMFASISFASRKSAFSNRSEVWRPWEAGPLARELVSSAPPYPRSIQRRSAHSGSLDRITHGPGGISSVPKPLDCPTCLYSRPLGRDYPAFVKHRSKSSDHQERSAAK